MPPTVSVVTPSYNQGRYISATIESVLSQEGDFLVDYLVVDGGSSDDSVEVIRRYAEAVERGRWPVRCRGVGMRWQSERDRGQSHAINKGLALARGEIAAYLNSDDLYFPGALARVVERFRAHPEDDFVFGDGEVIDEQGGRVWEWLSRPYDYGVLRSYHFLWNDFTNYIMQQATFWRRHVHERIGFFDESLHYSMDLEFWLRAGRAGLRLTHLPSKLGKFRMIQGTKSLSATTAFWLDNMELFRRHHPGRALARFFAYFHYNHAREAGLDFAAALAAERRLFERWAALPGDERERLRRGSAAGLRRARLLAAVDAYDKGDTDRARALVREAVRGRPWLIANPFAAPIVGRLFLGGRMSRRLVELVRRLVDLYRRKRYLYRYV